VYFLLKRDYLPLYRLCWPSSFVRGLGEGVDVPAVGCSWEHLSKHYGEALRQGA
jgi:hypothetical protein